MYFNGWIQKNGKKSQYTLSPLKFPSSSIEVINLVKVLEGEMSKSEIQEIIGLRDIKNLRENYI